MKEVKLTKGKIALVDDEDYALVSQYKWHASEWSCGGKFYARTKVNGKDTYMHNLIMGEKGIDHLNGDSLDNRKSSNLRRSTHQENLRNRGKQKTNASSQYKGVYYEKLISKWRAQINIGNGKIIKLGSFSNEQDAARAYDIAATEHFGEYALLNLS